MEELYQLITERLNGITDLLQKFSFMIDQLNTQPSLKLKPHHFNELSSLISNMKKAEKMRILRENDYLEVIMNLRTPDLPQRMYKTLSLRPPLIHPTNNRRFQSKSQEFIEALFPDFQKEKPKITGEFKDITILFLKFFEHLKLDTKTEELRRMYSTAKLISLPVLSVLAKWLIEITRKRYQEVIIDKSSALMSRLLSPTDQNPIPQIKSSTAKHASSEGSATKSEILQIEQQISEKLHEKSKSKASANESFQSKLKEFNEEIRKKYFPKVIPIPHNLATTVALKQIFSQADPQIFARTKSVRGSQDNANQENNPEKLNSTIQDQNGTSKPKYFLPFPKEAEISEDIQNKSSKFVNLTVREQAQGNCLDVISDLELGFMNFSAYNIMRLKKPRESKMIDVEKKKDQLVQHYKTLYQRNTDIERSISLYRSQLKDKRKLDYDPLLLTYRGEAYIETFSTTALVSRLSQLTSDLTKQKNTGDKTFQSFKKAVQVRIKTQQSGHRSSLNPTAESTSTTIKPEDTKLPLETPVCLSEFKIKVVVPKTASSMYRSRSELRKTFAVFPCSQPKIIEKESPSQDNTMETFGYRLKTSKGEKRINFEFEKNVFSVDVGGKSERIQAASNFYVQGEKRALTPLVREISGSNLKKSASLRSINSTKEEHRVGFNPAINLKIGSLPVAELTPINHSTTCFPYFSSRIREPCTRVKSTHISSGNSSQVNLHTSLEGFYKYTNREKTAEIESSKRRALQRRGLSSENRQAIIETYSDESFKNSLFQPKTSF